MDGKKMERILIVNKANKWIQIPECGYRNLIGKIFYDNINNDKRNEINTKKRQQTTISRCPLQPLAIHVPILYESYNTISWYTPYHAAPFASNRMFRSENTAHYLLFSKNVNFNKNSVRLWLWYAFWCCFNIANCSVYNVSHAIIFSIDISISSSSVIYLLHKRNNIPRDITGCELRAMKMTKTFTKCLVNMNRKHILINDINWVLNTAKNHSMP